MTQKAGIFEALCLCCALATSAECLWRLEVKGCHHQQQQQQRNPLTVYAKAIEDTDTTPRAYLVGTTYIDVVGQQSLA